MRHFAGHGGRLRRMPVGGKLLYTSFLVTVLAGLWVSMRLYGDITQESGTRGYYGASLPLVGTATAPRDHAGPALDLPAEPPRMSVPMGDRKLLEVTHFHLFSVPVYFLIVAHLFLLTGFSTLVRGAGAALVVLCSVIHIAAPWCVRAEGGLTWLVPVSGMAMGGSFLMVIAATLIDMWRSSPAHLSHSADAKP